MAGIDVNRLETLSEDESLATVIDDHQVLEAFIKNCKDFDEAELQDYFCIYGGKLLSPIDLLGLSVSRPKKAAHILRDCVYLRGKRKAFITKLEQNYARQVLHLYGQISLERPLSKEEFNMMKQYAKRGEN